MTSYFFQKLIYIVTAAAVHTTISANEPETGFVRSHCMNAIIKTASGSPVHKVTDLNTDTYWESEALLPDGFIGRNYLNVLHPGHPQRITTYNGPAADGNLNSMQMIQSKDADGKFRLQIPFTSIHTFIWLAAKVQAEKPVAVSLLLRNGRSFAGMLQPESNYQLTQLLTPVGSRTIGIVLESDAAFGVFEVAGLTEKPWEFISFDFGAPKEVGQIWTRHLSGQNVESIILEGSEDEINWQRLAVLDPAAIGYGAVVLSKALTLRWIRIVYRLSLEPYGKATCWELHAYDQYGPYGKPAPFVPDGIPLTAKMGINAIWGWGQGTYSDELPAGSGPKKFADVFSQARNYHEMTWDIKVPGERADYHAMKEKGTQAQWWLDWVREYNSWTAAGIRPVVSLQFNSQTVPAIAWTDPLQQARQYGSDFASYFGSGGQRLIGMAEVGNEPWDYPEGLYPAILLGMAGGIKSADPRMKVLPAATQACFPRQMGHLYNNYLPDMIPTEAYALLDGLNLHVYSHRFNEKGVREAVKPEHPASELYSIRNMLRWRNQHMPGKAVIVTEFGFDSQGGGESCTHAECVSEAQQAAWGLRAFLLLIREGASEAYWYFFANTFTDSYLHTRSGLLGSSNTGFAEKQSYRVFRQFAALCKDRVLRAVLRESNDFYAYLLEDAQGNKSMLVWDASSSQVNETFEKSFTIPFEAKRYITLNGELQQKWVTFNGKGFVSLPVGGFPILIE